MSRNEEQKCGSSLVVILRRVTNVVKVAPFVVAFFYLLTILSYMFMSDTFISILDFVVYTSPLCVVFLLILSRLLYLCKWHRLECVLPFICMLPALIDGFIPLTSIATYINAITLIFLIVVSLVNAYFVFKR